MRFRALAPWGGIHELLDNQRVIYFSLLRGPQSDQALLPDRSPDRNYANLGAGVALVLPKGLQVFLSFRALLASRLTLLVSFSRKSFKAERI